jgi:acyl-CoA thioester hydrolase
MTRIYTRTRDVTGADIDENGHVGNVEYLRWMQDVAVEHSARVGWPMERYFREQASWFVRSHFIEYVRPAVEGDRLWLHTWVAGMGTDRSPRRYLFRRERDGAAVVRAETLWVFVNHRTGRAQPIPDELRRAFPIVATEEQALAEIRASHLASA